ncbi:RNA polymerase sigma factor SigM [[Mycobacterium] wendilense]|uniref:RNA polymerase sigma factor SigM n=1 Tax=[Mycobacterium] wendilense TaxID=3064284 RepID=A0ABN9PD18_9MYCO|nr:RNA polymerase sigma factor SigM [Mycolicibacterium sp. MU0050]CAJ1587679.1 RNA polymerase sigma factor SigM [Mycolicibacterium sp. MU0050]
MVSTDSPVPAAAPRSDAELLTAHVAGDADAFAELFARHRPRLTRLAARRSDTPEDAADALQDAMLDAHRRAGGFRHHAAVGSWLYRIVGNACIDRFRMNAARREQWFDEDAHPVEDHTAQIETALLVRAALMRLPPTQRAAVLAVDMHGYSVGEAARLLGVPEGTVKSRRARARAQLRRTLAPRRRPDDGPAGH